MPSDSASVMEREIISETSWLAVTCSSSVRRFCSRSPASRFRRSPNSGSTSSRAGMRRLRRLNSRRLWFLRAAISPRSIGVPLASAPVSAVRTASRRSTALLRARSTVCNSYSAMLSRMAPARAISACRSMRSRPLVADTAPLAEARSTCSRLRIESAMPMPPFLASSLPISSAIIERQTSPAVPSPK
ncbi:hypothetical protein SI859A1_02491 [Aurantimonas manganoxydans SI85-9A1]|uniref:Uncharacterized protein n=1 Tax=Aurantimonas manganoxydans (strain ATCC BAA-1229 / DSM 21871 / SI85-9A1) TaxID=287752 RepID=Q1YLQ6_AURMS|nr:hypothetical protein SI859A1_02491 [Aurantimonas manganoxydans SI85-9A1]